MARPGNTYRANKPPAGKVRGQIRIVGPKGQKREQHPRRALDRATFKSMRQLQQQREKERATADEKAALAAADDAPGGLSPQRPKDHDQTQTHPRPEAPGPGDFHEVIDTHE